MEFATKNQPRLTTQRGNLFSQIYHNPSNIHRCVLFIVSAYSRTILNGSTHLFIRHFRNLAFLYTEKKRFYTHVPPVIAKTIEFTRQNVPLNRSNFFFTTLHKETSVMRILREAAWTTNDVIIVSSFELSCLSRYSFVLHPTIILEYKQRHLRGDKF